MDTEKPEKPRQWIDAYRERGDHSDCRKVASETRHELPEKEQERSSSNSPQPFLADEMDRLALAAPTYEAASGTGHHQEERIEVTRRRAPAYDEGDSTGKARQQDTAADTEDPEDIGDLGMLLLPSGAFPRDVDQFSVSYSRAVLNGWVKQDSPCCAASSVAGAWNAVQGLTRRQAGALDSEAVLKAMRAVLEKQISDMMVRFERLLGASIGPLISAIRTELSLEGKHLGGHGPKTTIASGPHLLRLTRRITEREHARAGSSSIATSDVNAETMDRASSPKVFERLWEMYESERTNAAATEEIRRGAGQDSAVLTIAAAVTKDGTGTGAGFDPLPKPTKVSQTKTIISTTGHGAPAPAPSRCQVVDTGKGQSPPPSGVSSVNMSEACVVHQGSSSKSTLAPGRSGVSGSQQGRLGIARDPTQGFVGSNLIPRTDSIAIALTVPSGLLSKPRETGTPRRVCEGAHEGRSEQAMPAEEAAQALGVCLTEKHVAGTDGWEKLQGHFSVASDLGVCPSGGLERSSFWRQDESEGIEVTGDEGDEGDQGDDVDDEGDERGTSRLGTGHDTGAPLSLDMKPDEQGANDEDAVRSTLAAGSRAPCSANRGGSDMRRSSFPLEGGGGNVTMVQGLTEKEWNQGKPTGHGGRRLKKTRRKSSAAGRWRWKKDLCDLLKRIGGLEKVWGRKPSTGALGNWGVITTVQYLDNELASSAKAQVTANLFMGKACSPRGAQATVPLSAQDTEDDIARQWNSLREAFLQEGQVLVFHLTNHYALIFALREWLLPACSACFPTMPSPPTPPDTAHISTGNCPQNKTSDIHPHRGPGKRLDGTDSICNRKRELGFSQQSDDAVEASPRASTSSVLAECTQAEGKSERRWTREMLTARRGQRPATWISFQEARKIMLGWKGYKIINVRRGQRKLVEVPVLR